MKIWVNRLTSEWLMGQSSQSMHPKKMTFLFPHEITNGTVTPGLPVSHGPRKDSRSLMKIKFSDPLGTRKKATPRALSRFLFQE